MPNPEQPRQPLPEQPWFVDWLAAKGFAKSSPTTFIKGKASIHVEGTKFTADSGTDDGAWSADLGNADPATIKMIVESVLKMRPFLTEAVLAKEQAHKQRVERALTGIATTIKDSPDTHGGIQLRCFLWSLYNGEHLLNLYHMASILDGKRSAWVSDVFAAAFSGALHEDDIKRALLVAGEMKRWDEVEPSDEHQRDIEEAARRIESVLRSIPPSYSHEEMFSAREALRRAQEALRRAKNPKEDER